LTPVGPPAVNSSSNVTFTNVVGRGDRAKQWVSFLYTVSNVTAGEAHVSVNGGTPVNLSALNSRAGHFETVTVALALKEGTNTLTFGATAKEGRGMRHRLLNGILMDWDLHRFRGTLGGYSSV
jgi:hypothetical protein